MSKPDDQPDLEQLPEGAQEAVAALGDLGDGLAKLQELNDEQFHEVVSLLETIGKDDAADALRTTRRDLLKTGATAAAGLGVGATAAAGLTDRASAGTQQAGTIGSSSSPVDVEAEDINADAVTTGKLSNITEFLTPADGKFHSVDESTLKSLMDNHDVIVCPPEQSVTFSSTKTLSKADHDDLTLICPWVQNPHRAVSEGFSIKAGGDNSIIEVPTTEDIGGLTIFGIGFDGSSNTTTGTPLLDIGDGFVIRVERCKFTSGSGSGIELNGDVINSRIKDNRFNTSSDPCIDVTSKIGTFHIEGNFIGESHSGRGIRVTSSNPKDVRIRNNIIFGGTDGIFLNPTDAEGIAVAGNTITSTSSNGIGVAGNPIPIINNTIGAAAGDGIFAPGGPVVGNSVYNCGGNGIAANADSVVVGNVVLNNGQSSGSGIVARRFKDGQKIAWNVVRDTQSTATQTYGIDIGSSAADRIIGPNDVSGNATGPINDGGIRTLFALDGSMPIGQNAGNPNSGGDWNGNGRRGVIVEDTNNSGDAYLYLAGAGAWTQIGT